MIAKPTYLFICVHIVTVDGSDTHGQYKN